MEIKMLVEIEKTRKGFPAFWEKGGGYSNTGEAIVITSQSGAPKKPVYIRRRGHLANDNHALFILELGDYIIEAKHHRRNFEVEIYKVIGFESKNRSYFSTGDTLYKMRLNEFISKYGRLEKYPKLLGFAYDTYRIDKKTAAQSSHIFKTEELEIVELKEEVYEETYAIVKKVNSYNPHLKAAIRAAKEKATCYHCREPHFAIV
jgi:hypothetical protein